MKFLACAAFFFVSVALLEACGSGSLGTTDPSNPSNPNSPKSPYLPVGSTTYFARKRSAQLSLVSVFSSLKDSEEAKLDALGAKIEDAIRLDELPMNVFDKSRRLSHGAVELLFTIDSESCGVVENVFRKEPIASIGEIKTISIRCP
ncbi:hypothetical protein QR680_005704 [Steinernema hermaphroditum]|uniref:Uncharacterized protein n=1 Tax=Steinernema hermaphroditum TaxID=289476 RepID=A0AA39LW65_9BILA|nr:hypothetical protein QR680_005704 [Steinernema hermaphroditum]